MTGSDAQRGERIEDPDNRERILVRLVRAVARDLGAECHEGGGSWVLEVRRGARRAFVYGYDFSLNEAPSQLIAKDKAAAAEILARHGVPCVPHRLVLAPELSHYIGVESSRQVLLDLFAEHGESLVVKPNEGTSSGHGVVHVRSASELESRAAEIWSRHRGLAASPHVEILAEWRCVVVDQRVRLMYQKVRGEDWRHNLGLGAQASLLDPTASPEQVELGRRAARALRLRACAVDVVRCREGLRVLEVNSGLMFEHLVRQVPAAEERVEAIYREVLSLCLRIK